MDFLGFTSLQSVHQSFLDPALFSFCSLHTSGSLQLCYPGRSQLVSYLLLSLLLIYYSRRFRPDFAHLSDLLITVSRHGPGNYNNTLLYSGVCGVKLSIWWRWVVLFSRLYCISYKVLNTLSLKDTCFTYIRLNMLFFLRLTGCREKKNIRIFDINFSVVSLLQTDQNRSLDKWKQKNASVRDSEQLCEITLSTTDFITECEQALHRLC